jgi:hypothetical protein
MSVLRPMNEKHVVQYCHQFLSGRNEKLNLLLNDGSYSRER